MHSAKNKVGTHLPGSQEQLLRKLVLELREREGVDRMRAARLRSGEGEGRRRGEPARAQEDECSHPSSHASQFSCLPVLTHLIGHLQCAFFIVQALTHPLLHLLHLRSQVPPAKVLVLNGLAAIQTAKNMGAVVRTFEVRAVTK